MPRQIVDAFFGGVSTQPPTRRAKNQVEVADNVIFSVARGAEKRPGGKYHGDLVPDKAKHGSANVALDTLDSSLIISEHIIDRGDGERYIMFMYNHVEAPIRIFALEAYDDGMYSADIGEELVIQYPGTLTASLARTYLGLASAGARPSFVTIADSTFIASNKTAVDVVALASAANNDPDLITDDVATGGSLKYKGDVIPNPGSATPRAPAAGEAAIYYADSTHPYDGTSSALHIDALRGHYVDHNAASSTPNQFFPLFVDNPDELPEENISSLRNPATTLALDDVDPVYMEAKNSGSTGPLGWYKWTTGGVGWAQTPQPNAEGCYLDPATMPILVQRGTSGADIVFTVTYPTWTPRYNGDDVVSPRPSFVGKIIKDIALFQDRFVIATDTHVTFSEIGNYTNFYLNDYSTPADDDRIDIALSGKDVLPIIHIVPMENALVVSTENGKQFELQTNDEAFTSNSIIIKQSTAYPFSRTLAPILVGQALWAPANKDNRLTSLYEYYREGGRTSNRANQVSAHVEGYIPSDITHIVGNDSYQTIMLGGDNLIYVYRYYYLDNKVQSSWARWVFPGTETIRGMYMDSKEVTVVLEAKEGVGLTERYNILKFALDTEQSSTDLAYEPRLDNRVKLDLTYNIGSGTFTALPSGYSVAYDGNTRRTTFTLPFDDNYGVETAGLQYWLVIASGDRKGYVASSYSVSSPATGQTEIVFNGDYRNDTVFIGRSYDMDIQLSPIYLRDNEGLPRTSARTILQYLTINYDDSLHYKLRVDYPQGTSREYTSATAQVGGGNTTLGAGLHTGSDTFLLMSNSEKEKIHITNRTPAPCIINSLEYNLEYYDRRR